MATNKEKLSRKYLMLWLSQCFCNHMTAIQGTWQLAHNYDSQKGLTVTWSPFSTFTDFITLSPTEAAWLLTFESIALYIARNNTEQENFFQICFPFVIGHWEEGMKLWYRYFIVSPKASKLLIYMLSKPWVPNGCVAVISAGEIFNLIFLYCIQIILANLYFVDKYMD